MSWGALPWWVYELTYEHELAKMSCSFESEWFSGTPKCMPDYVIQMSTATFKTHEVGGWNYSGDMQNA